MDSHRKVMTQPAAVVQTGLKSSDDLPTFETKGSGESSTYSSVLTIESKAAASTKLAKHAVGTPDISDTPEKRVSRLQSTHSGYSDSGIFESSSLAAKQLPLSRLPVLLRDMYSEYVEDSHFSVSTSYAEIQTSDSLESTPALTKRNTLERSTSTSMFAPNPRSPPDPISPITPTNSTLQLVKMEEMEGAASDRSSTFAISSTPLLRRCHIAGETGASAATSGIFEAAGSVLTESDERLGAAPARSQTLPQAMHDVSGQHRSELRSKPPLPRVFHKSSGSLKAKKQQPKKTHPARRAASGASLLSLFGFRRKATSLQKQQPTAMPQPPLTKISTLPVEKPEERQARAMGTGVSTTPGWSASLYSSMSGDLGEVVRVHDDQDDIGAASNELDALATQKTHRPSVLPQASHTARAETTDQSMGAIVCAQAGLVHAAADEPHAASENDQPTWRLSTTEVILAGNEEMEPREADAEDEVIGISERNLQPFSSREEAELAADNRSGSGYTPSRRRSSASGGEISASNDSSSDSVEASWYRPHFSASDQEVKGGRKKKAKHRRWRQEEEKDDSKTIDKQKEIKDEDRTKQQQQQQQQTAPPSGKPDISILDASTEIPHDITSKIENKLPQQTHADINQADKITAQKTGNEMSTPQESTQTHDHVESPTEEVMQTNPATKASDQTVDEKSDNQKHTPTPENKTQSDESTTANNDQKNAESRTETGRAEAELDVDAGRVPEVPMKAAPVVVDVPTVDIQASVPGDVELPSLDVKAPDLDGEMNVKADIEMPEAHLDIEPPAADMKVDAGGKFELPSLKVKLPHPHLKLGASGKAKAPKVDVEMPQAEADLDVSGKVDVPSTKVVIDADTDLDVDAGGKIGGIGKMGGFKVKMPHAHLKMGKSGKVKGPKVDVEMPEVDAGLDVSGGIDVNADADLDVDGGGKIGLKKPKSPSFKLKLPHAHWKMGKSGKVKGPKVDVEMPEVDAGLDVSGGVEVPSAGIDVNADADLDVDGGGKIGLKKPKSPSFKVKLPHAHWKMGKSGKLKIPQAELETPHVDAGLDVSGGVDVPSTELKLDVDTDMDVGAGGKVDVHGKSPSFKFKMPKWHLDKSVKVEVPKVTAEFPEVDAGMKLDTDIRLPEARLDIDGAKAGLDIDAGIVPEVSMKAAPVVVDVPTVDIQASVPGDVELPSLDVKAPDLDGEMNVKADIEMPEAHLDIEPPAADMKVDAGGKFELPSLKVKLPHPHLKLGASGKAKAPKVDVEMPQAEADLDVSGKVDVPSTKVVIDADTDLDVDAGGKIGGIGKMGGFKVKMPHAHLKMGKSGKVKGPKVDVEMPEVDAGLDVSGGVEVPSAGIDVNADADLDVDGGGKIGLKKPKSPSFKLKLPHAHWKMGKSGKVKGPKVDVEMPEVDAGLDVSGGVEVPSAGIDVNADADLDVDGGGKIGLKKPKSPSFKVKLPHAHWKMGKSGKVKGPKVDVEMPEVDAGLDVSGGVEVPSAGIDVNADADLDVDGGGKIGLKKPKSPSFKVKLPHAHWKMGKSGKLKIPQAELETPHVDAGLDVSGGVDVPSTELKLDVDTDMDVGAGGKVDVHGKSPSFKFKMPKWHLDKSVKVEVPKVTAEFPEVDAGMKLDTDIRLPEARLDIDGAKAGLDIDAGIVPEVSMKAAPVVVDVPTVDIQASVPGDVELPSLDVKAPDLDGEMNVKADIEMPEAHLDIEPPAADMKVDAGGKFELPSLKVKLPHPHLKLGASGKAKAPKVDVEMPQAEADLDVSGKVDVPSTKVVIDADTDLDVDAGGKIGGIGKMGGFKVKMPHAHLKMGKSGKVKGPKVDVEMPEVDAGLDVSGGVEVPSAGIDVNADADLDVDGGGKIGLKKPKSPSFKLKLPHAHWKMGKSGKVKGPKVDVEMPEVDAGLDVSGGVEVPSAGIDVNADADLDVDGGGKIGLKKPKSPSFKVKLPHAHWKMGKSGKVKGPKVDVEMPEVDAGLDVSGGVEVPSAGIDVNADADLDVDGGGKIGLKKPKSPSFKVKLPHAHWKMGKSGKLKIPQAELETPHVDAGLDVSGGVDVPSTELKLDVDTDMDVGAGGKVDVHGKSPSFKFKMPKWHLDKSVKVEVPKVTAEFPEVDAGMKLDTDIRLPEARLDIDGAKAGLDIDAGIVPEVSMKAAPVVVDVPTVDIQASVPGDVELPSLDVKAPDLDGEMNVKADIEMPEAHLDIEPPAADMKVDAGGKFELPSLKVKLPHPHLKLGASGKAKAPKVDVEMPQAEADLDVSGKVDVPSTKVVIDADTDLDVDAGGKIGGIGKMGGFKVKMPHAHLKMGKSGKVKGPKVDVEMPEVDAGLDVSGGVEVPSAGIDVNADADLDVDGGGKIGLKKPKSPSFKLKLPHAHWKMGKSGKVKGPKVDVEMPEVDAGLDVSGGVEVPSAGIDVNADADLDVDGGGKIGLKKPKSPSFKVKLPHAHWKMGKSGKLKIPQAELETPHVDAGLDVSGGVDVPSTELKLDVDTDMDVGAGGKVDVHGKSPSFKFKMPKWHLDKSVKVEVPKVTAEFPEVDAGMKLDTDIRLPEARLDIDGAKAGLDIDAGIVPEVSMKAAPVVVDVPTVDIQASVPGDVELPSLDVKAPDLDGEMNVKADIEMPEAHLDIEPPAADMKVDAGGKFELPSLKVKLPHPHLKLGASGKAKAPKVDVEMPQAEADLDVSGKVDVPSTKVVIDADTDLDVDAGGKIGGIGKMGGFKVKMPHAHLKMGKSGKMKGPKVDVEMPEVDAGLDVSGGVEVPSAGIDVNADADLDVDGGGKIGLKKPKSPSFKLKLPHAHWKMGKSGKVKGPKVDVEMPEVDAGLDVSGGVEVPSAGIDVNADADLDVDGGGKIGLKKPKSPSFKVKLPHAHWKMGKSGKLKIPQAELETPHVDAGLDVSGGVDVPSTELKLDVDTDMDVGAGGKVDVHGKSPSFKFKMPKWHLDKSVKVEVPKVTAEFPEVDAGMKLDTDIRLPEARLDIDGAKAGLDIDAGIVPEVSMKAAPVVVDVPTVDIQASVPGDVELPSLDVKAPDLDGEMNVKADIEMPEAHLDIEPPAADMKVDAGGKFELPSLKVKLPHPHLKLGASGKAKAPKVDVEMPQAEADLDVSGKVDVPSTKVVIDADTDLDVDAGGKIGGIGKMGGFKVKMPHAHLKMGKSGKVKGPKVDVEMPEVDAGLDVSGGVEVPSAGIDVNADADLDVDGGGKIGLKKPKSPSFKLKLPHAHWKMGKSGKVKGAKVDVEMPEVDAGLDVSGGVEVPSAGIDVNADADLDVDGGGKIGLKKPKSPSFKVKLPHAHWKMGKSGKLKIPQAELETPHVDAGLDVSGGVDVPSTELKLDVDTDMDVGAGGKVDVHGKSPSFKFKMPKWHLDKSVKVEVPKVTAEFPEVDAGMKLDTDIRLPEARLDIDGAKAGLDIDAGIVPEVSMKAAPVVVDVPTVDIQASVPGDVELPSLDVKAPDLDGEMNVKADIEMPEAHLDIEPPAADMKVDAGGKFELPSLKVKLPHPHLKLGASGKAKAPKVDVEMPQAEADLDVSGKVDVPSTKVVIDADTDLDVDAGGKIGGIGKMGGFKVKMPHAHLKMGKSGKVKGPKVDVDMPAVVVYSPDVSAPASDLVSSGGFVSSAPGTCGNISVVDSRVRSAAVHLGGLDDVDHGSVPGLRAGVSLSSAPSSQLSPPISPFALSESESSEVESASDTPPFSSPPEFWAHSVTPELGKSYGVHGGASLPRSKEEDLVVSEDLKKVGFRPRWPWSSQRVTPNVTAALSPQQRKMSSSSSGVVEGSPPNKKRKRPLKPEKRKRKNAPEKTVAVGSLSRRDEDLGIQADISTTVQSSAPKFEDTLESGQKRDWSWKLGGRAQHPSAEVQVEEPQITPLQSSTPSKAIAFDSRPKKHFAGLFKSKSTRKATATVDVREPLQVSVEMRKPSSSSRSSATEQPQRQTWHAPSINDTDVDSERPPTPPLPCLPDADISKDLAVAYRRYYAYGSPLRKPRPWSTLDFPPRNCKFRNDDNLFPYAITPTKLPSCNWKTEEEYDVPYMDDDALPEEEPEWALGESRRTLTLATADVASFQTSLLAAGEPSEASFEKSPHTKKSLSLRAFSRSKKPAKEDRKTSKRTKSGMPNPEDRAPLQGPVDIEASGGR